MVTKASSRHPFVGWPCFNLKVVNRRLELVGQTLLPKRWVAQRKSRYAASLPQLMHGAGRGQSLRLTGVPASAESEGLSNFGKSSTWNWRFHRHEHGARKERTRPESEYRTSRSPLSTADTTLSSLSLPKALTLFQRVRRPTSRIQHYYLRRCERLCDEPVNKL